MSSVTPGVGDDIESICSKCGDVWHVIVAKVEDRIAKVECKECGRVHRYKAPKGTHVTKAAPTRRKKSATTKSRSKTKDPEAALVEPDLSKPARPYKASETFEPGERIDHAKFGQGVCQGSAGQGKLKVLFGTELKVLATVGRAERSLHRPAPFDHARPDNNNEQQ